METIQECSKTDPIKGNAAQLCRNLFEYLLTARFDQRPEIYTQLLTTIDFTPQQAARCIALVERFRQEKPETTKFLGGFPSLIRRKSNPPMQPAEDNSAAPKDMLAARFWPAFDASDKNERQIETLLWRDGRLWVQSHVFDILTHVNSIRIDAVDLHALQSESVVLNDAKTYVTGSCFEVVGGDLFILRLG